MTLFSFLLLVKQEDRKELLLFPFSSRSNTENEEALKKEILDLKTSVADLEQQVFEVKNYPSDNIDTAILEAELKSVQTNLNNLNETIMEKPDTAITAKLLREKQELADQKMDNLIRDQQRVEDKVDSFLANIIAVPIYAALAGFAFTLIAVIVTPLFTKLNNKLFEKETDIDV